MLEFDDMQMHPFSEATESARGAVYTKREVVDAILDLVGYETTELLHERSILEPASGNGDFLFPTIERLLESFLSHGGTLATVGRLADCLLAVEINSESHRQTKEATRRLLVEKGVNGRTVDMLVERWFRNVDFLLEAFDCQFDYVVGNPPYIRQERIPERLLNEYRARFHTLYDRADIYIPFIEKSLGLLKAEGQLGFICADRWMKNKYGGPLRDLVSRGFQLKYVLSVDDVDAFTSEVSAYPAIFVLEKTKADKTTRVATPPRSLPELTSTVAAMKGKRKSATFQEMTAVVSGKSPWLVQNGETVGVLRELERTLPTLEDAGCKVGIGVATGADKIFIGALGDLDVEPSRKLPLVTTKDIRRGNIQWRGHGVLNPFEADGSVVSLAKYPRFARYIENNEDLIKKRNVAKRSGAGWFRTIDRIYPELVAVPKLLIPDIKGEANVVLDTGDYYPHHNLYYITSEHWDLRALQAVLRSSVTRLFIANYSTKMRGGFLRYQAQYLRRIRIPHWINVSAVMRAKLTAAAHANDLDACNAAALELYGLTESDVEI